MGYFYQRAASVLAMLDATETPPWDNAHLKLAVDAAGVALWSWNVDTDALSLDGRACDLWGIARSTTVTFEDLAAHIHPADRNRVRKAFVATRAILDAYEIDFRILVSDTVRWISARGQGDNVGMVDRIMFGIFLDVTGRKQAEEAHELLAGEMSHRVKNLLTIAAGLTAITSRSAKTAQEMARDLTTRLIALGRAHDLVRPVPGEGEKVALLGDLLSLLLAPYNDLSTDQNRIHVTVPRIGVGEGTATTLSVVIHELATNAVKYGAFSVAGGTLDLSCTVQGNDVVIVWTERGGLAVVTPEKLGFGSRLIAKSVSGQLKGTADYNWSKEGLIVTLAMGKDRLAA